MWPSECRYQISSKGGSSFVREFAGLGSKVLISMNILSIIFTNMFSSEVSVPDSEVLGHVKKCITVEMNEALPAPFSADYVRKTLFDIGDLKVPGPDGLHEVFYKCFWPMLGNDLVRGSSKAIMLGS